MFAKNSLQKQGSRLSSLSAVSKLSLDFKMQPNIADRGEGEDFFSKQMVLKFERKKNTFFTNIQVQGCSSFPGFFFVFFNY